MAKGRFCYKWTTVLITTPGFFGGCFFFSPLNLGSLHITDKHQSPRFKSVTESIPGKQRKATNLSSVVKFYNLSLSLSFLIFLYYYSLSLWYCARFAPAHFTVCARLWSLFSTWGLVGWVSNAEIAHAALSSSQTLRGLRLAILRYGRERAS